MKKAGFSFLEIFMVVVCLITAIASCYLIYSNKMKQEKKMPVFLIQPIKNNPVENSAPSREPANEQTSEIISLTEDNSVVMDQVFSDQSVQDVMRQLQTLSNKLPKNAIIYLVMNSPGGSVVAGHKLISFIKALPQKVKTLSIFSASMAFQTVQQLDERLILENGTLMSHQASFGVQGRTGEVKNRLKWIMSMVNKLDQIAAKRMGMSLKDYQELIQDEYWVYDSNAVQDKAADRMVLAKCGKGMEGTRKSSVSTMFGTFVVEVSKCPLIPGFISVTAPAQDYNREAANYVKLMFDDRKTFTEQFIVNNKFEQFQK